jgi:hypothetical protein
MDFSINVLRLGLIYFGLAFVFEKQGSSKKRHSYRGVKWAAWRPKAAFGPLIMS